MLIGFDETKFHSQEAATIYKRRPDFEDDTEWQEYFERLRKIIKPVNSKYMPLHNYNVCMIDGTYIGETEYKRFSWFINDVLRQIRHKDRDYCYFVYQIAELLKYEPESLQTKFIKGTKDDPGYIMVWLV